MTKFYFRYRVEPQGPFGLPEEAGHIVVPLFDVSGNKTEIHSAPVDNFTFKESGHGSLSRYRDEKHRVNIKQEIPNGFIAFKDNYMEIELMGSNIDAVINNAHIYSERAMEALSAKKVTPFKAIPVVFFDENKKIYNKNTVKLLGMSFTTYDIDEISKQIEESLVEIRHFDEALDKAAFYFRHALILNKMRNHNMEHWVGHSVYMASSVILNFWKATTSIMGDPANAKGGYQKKYKIYGLDDNYKFKMDEAKKIRDNKNIAHHSTGADSLEIAQQDIHKVCDVARVAINAYLKYLMRA